MIHTMPSLPADYHSHTRLCKHAAGDPIDYARAARPRGLPELAATDHGPTPFNYDPRHRMEMDQFPEYLRGVEAAQRDQPGLVLLGIEADYFEGCESFMAGWLAAQPFDVVLGSIHYLSPPAMDATEFKPLWDFGGMRGTWKRYFELVGKLADSGLYDVVGHLDMLKRNGGRLPDRDLRECALPALDRIAAAGMAIEINTSGLRHAVKEMYPSPLLLSWARERGIPIVFGSDAHQPDQVGAEFKRAVQLARECGYTRALRFRRRARSAVPLDLPAAEAVGRR
ncbi:MAG: histidinol-phosphatase HisJ family protein [Kiritimatiellae bacterium]|nr:histidinol-phosphatase HisJ family protein [Kiritimatiellia bacterium]